MTTIKEKFKKWIKDTENKWIGAGFLAIGIAITTPIIIFFTSNSTLSANSFAKLGTVGDFLGGTTVGLLSLASILFLISTIVMQRKELGIQREELKLTIEELAKANKQYEITNETMLKQQFETTFFNMINMHNSLVDGLTLFQKDVKGKDVFIMLHEEIKIEHRSNNYELFIKKLMKEYEDELFLFYVSYEACCNELLEFDIVVSVPQKNLFYNDVMWYLETGYFLLENDEKLSFIDYFIIDYQKMLNIIHLEDNLIVSLFVEEFLVGEKWKKKAYDMIMYNNYNVLNNYYKSIILIFEFVKNSKLNCKDEKKRYVSIFCSQFTPIEKLFIHYEINFGGNTNLNTKQINYLQFENGLIDSIL